jgi:predicted nucleotidyltransferase
MSMTVEIPEVAVAAARLLADAASSPARVVLFGSHARGDAREGSDLDFLVIEDDVPSPYHETIILRRALRGLGVPVDIVVLSAADAAAPRSLAVRDGIREGIVLHERAA